MIRTGLFTAAVVAALTLSTSVFADSTKPAAATSVAKTQPCFPRVFLTTSDPTGAKDKDGKVKKMPWLAMNSKNWNTRCSLPQDDVFADPSDINQLTVEVVIKDATGKPTLYHASWVQDKIPTAPATARTAK